VDECKPLSLCFLLPAALQATVLFSFMEYSASTRRALLLGGTLLALLAGVVTLGTTAGATAARSAARRALLQYPGNSQFGNPGNVGFGGGRECWIVLATS
jgi:hypothetical protein